MPLALSRVMVEVRKASDIKLKVNKHPDTIRVIPVAEKAKIATGTQTPTIKASKMELLMPINFPNKILRLLIGCDTSNSVNSAALK